MEIPFYHSLEEFKENYLIDFSQPEFKEITYYKYLMMIKYKYEGILQGVKTVYSLQTEEVRKDLQNILKKYENAFIPQLLPELNNILTTLGTGKFPSIKIIEFVESKIEDEKINMLRGTPTPLQEQPDEPLTESKTKKVGLLLRTGIVELLKTNYNANTNQIAEFFDKITFEHLKAENSKSYFYESNKSYAIKNKQDRDELDFMLKRIFKNAKSN